MPVQIIQGDSCEVMKTLADDSIHSVVTDPPYGLQFMGKEWDKLWRNDSVSDRKYVDRTEGQLTSRSRKLPSYNATDPQQMQAWHEAWARQCLRVLKPGGFIVAFSGTRTYHRMACAIEDSGFEIRDMLSWLYGSGFPKSRNMGDGWGTALKPACEPICFGRKPLIGTVAANMAEHNTGAINIDCCRVGNRWPANVVHDGSEEVLAGFPHTASRQDTPVKGASAADRNGNGSAAYGAESRLAGSVGIVYGDEGSAARFFYTAKADAEDRFGSKHPTVKPVDLMQWLVRLVTPKGGTVLDPFAGTGTTGEAAFREGMNCILIEREEEYFKDIHARMAFVEAGPIARLHARIKNSGKSEGIETTPLFVGEA